MIAESDGGHGSCVGSGQRSRVSDGIVEVLRENNWVVTTEQLLGAGLSPDRIRRLVRRGVLISPRRGTYIPRMMASKASANDAHAEALRVAAAVARSGQEM